MLPRPPNTIMKLPRQLSSFSPPALRLPHTIPSRHANPRFPHTSISTAARRPNSCAFPAGLLRRSPPHCRPASSSSTPSPAASVDAVIETLTDLYNTARDEFEIAAEETEKKSTYGPEDREAAHEAFRELKGVYADAVAGVQGKEVEKRVGRRVQELEIALKNMDELAMED